MTTETPKTCSMCGSDYYSRLVMYYLNSREEEEPIDPRLCPRCFTDHWPNFRDATHHDAPGEQSPRTD